jgi:hypothetical protein
MTSTVLVEHNSPALISRRVVLFILQEQHLPVQRAADAPVCGQEWNDQ